MHWAFHLASGPPYLIGAKSGWLLRRPAHAPQACLQPTTPPALPPQPGQGRGRIGNPAPSIFLSGGLGHLSDRWSGVSVTRGTCQVQRDRTGRLAGRGSCCWRYRWIRPFIHHRRPRPCRTQTEDHTAGGGADRTGHSRTVWSSLVVASKCPSGANAAPLTASVWPVNGG